MEPVGLQTLMFQQFTLVSPRAKSRHLPLKTVALQSLTHVAVEAYTQLLCTEFQVRTIYRT